MAGDGDARPFLSTTFNERGARFSPDGRRLAYESDETGRFEIYVQAFPESGSKLQLTTEGGVEPIWSPDGAELFFRSLDGGAGVERAARWCEPARPEKLFVSDHSFSDNMTHP